MNKRKGYGVYIDIYDNKFEVKYVTRVFVLRLGLCFCITLALIVPQYFEQGVTLSKCYLVGRSNSVNV